jgi:hypothetical protein
MTWVTRKFTVFKSVPGMRHAGWHWGQYDPPNTRQGTEDTGDKYAPVPSRMGGMPRVG